MIGNSKAAEHHRARRDWRRLAGGLVLVGGLLLLAALGLLLSGERPPELDSVRATVEPTLDGLQVVTSWHPASPVDAVRVSVNPDGAPPQISTRLGAERADTVLLAAAPLGETVAGSSCVVPLREGAAGEERCTPWQFVRPQATPRGAESAVAGGSVTRIVVRPSGLQVDPDVDGRCAEWQRRNAARSPWIEVNRRAVPACTGPNGKPTVAQFCAFAVLPGGEQVITENSRGNAYCERLFLEWADERTL